MNSAPRANPLALPSWHFMHAFAMRNGRRPCGLGSLVAVDDHDFFAGREGPSGAPDSKLGIARASSRPLMPAIVGQLVVVRVHVGHRARRGMRARADQFPSCAGAPALDQCIAGHAASSCPWSGCRDRSADARLPSGNRCQGVRQESRPRAPCSLTSPHESGPGEFVCRGGVGSRAEGRSSTARSVPFLSALAVKNPPDLGSLDFGPPALGPRTSPTAGGSAHAVRSPHENHPPSCQKPGLVTNFSTATLWARRQAPGVRSKVPPRGGSRSFRPLAWRARPGGDLFHLTRGRGSGCPLVEFEIGRRERFWRRACGRRRPSN